MTSSSIGSYTEKKIFTKIKQLKKQIDDLESYIKNPPSIIINGIMDIPSDYFSQSRSVRWLKIKLSLF